VRKGQGWEKEEGRSRVGKGRGRIEAGERGRKGQGWEKGEEESKVGKGEEGSRLG
jgi:hypothetical protein